MVERSRGEAVEASRVVPRPGNEVILALVLGGASIVCALLIGFIGYRISVHNTEHGFQRFYLDKAETLAALSERRSELSDRDLLEAINEAWGKGREHPPDEYVCVVDGKSLLVLHTAHPETLGNYVGVERAHRRRWAGSGLPDGSGAGAEKLSGRLYLERGAGPACRLRPHSLPRLGVGGASFEGRLAARGQRRLHPSRRWLSGGVRSAAAAFAAAAVSVVRDDAGELQGIGRGAA